jgi:glycolate oxidase iron-sulfur subunit
MQTSIAEEIKLTPAGQEADSILRKCVHCGFCTATCPTYQILGDELDGPRGRIYLIKQVLEGEQTSRKTQSHLDRCLTCRACETTCPSGVNYHRLADIGRQIVETRVSRPLGERVMRRALRAVLPYPERFGPLLRLGQSLRPLLPVSIKKKVPPLRRAEPWPQQRHSRQMLILQACGQSTAMPTTNAATARLLDKLGIELVTASGSVCCGAVSHHLGAEEEGLDFMRRNIDAWWPYIDNGAEAIVITASGCGSMVKEYAEALQHDPDYADKAARISALSRDISEVLADEDLEPLQNIGAGRKVAFHSPCSLQHGQQISGVVENILERAGFTLTKVPDSHLCCGSAGTYSLLQRTLSQQLLDSKLTALQSGKPDVIATANIGCHMHLESGSETPVVHWVELLDANLSASDQNGV